MVTDSKFIIKFDFSSEQTVGEITKVVGLVKIKYLIPIIDIMDLEANPRSSATGPVTDAIQESLESDPELFPFKTKGILLASSRYERLERNRYEVKPDNRDIEGILDGGHNTLAIGLHILKVAMDYKRLKWPRGKKNWAKFKELWHEYRNVIEEYQDAMRSDSAKSVLKVYVPIELLVPRDPSDMACVESFKNDLLEICSARNNNAELTVSDKNNQLGFYDVLRTLMESYDNKLCQRIEWKSNEGGDVKIRDIIALAWIPLSLVTPVKDENGKIIEPVAPKSIYSSKGICVKQYEKLMSSPEVTMETTTDYKHELKNQEVCSALEIAVQLPALFDIIYECFPKYYNAAGGSYGSISAVKTLNDKSRDHRSPYGKKVISTLSPDGFIIPLVYGLQAIMQATEVNGTKKINWKCDPFLFIEQNLEPIVKHYSGMIGMAKYDPQKVGKADQCYREAISAFKMAFAGVL